MPYAPAARALSVQLSQTSHNIKTRTNRPWAYAVGVGSGIKISTQPASEYPASSA